MPKYKSQATGAVINWEGRNPPTGEDLEVLERDLNFRNKAKVAMAGQGVLDAFSLQHPVQAWLEQPRMGTNMSVDDIGTSVVPVLIVVALFVAWIARSRIAKWRKAAQENMRIIMTNLARFAAFYALYAAVLYPIVSSEKMD